ncbi:Cobalamin (Vitamin B12) biosynthesis CbiM transporter [groundwater metagenome]|uniref:Cobalamin (Vitamin B12) biosynthesis CbiM transporter n=1 Tax=groundwater metagenome TaxID=717931 RepID=A0A098ECE0_9ZZZZ
MHIPDGFLSPPIFAGMWIIAILIIGYAVKKTNKKLGDKHVPLMGVLAAFIFAAQMLNTPVTGGTSGHMLGGVLAAIFLGPFCSINCYGVRFYCAGNIFCRWWDYFIRSKYI